MLIRIRHLRAVLNCEGKKCMPSSFEKNDKKRNHDTHDNQWTAQSPMLPTREPHLILHYFHGLPVAQMDISLQCAGVGWGLRAHLIDCTAHTDADPIKGGWTTLPINGSHFHVSLCWPTPSGCKQLNQSVNQTWFIWPFLSIETQFKVLCNKNTEYDGDLTYAKTYIPSSTPALTHTKRTRLAGRMRHSSTDYRSRLDTVSWKTEVALKAWNEIDVMLWILYFMRTCYTDSREKCMHMYTMSTVSCLRLCQVHTAAVLWDLFPLEKFSQ